jgi:hypothetical protein
MITFKSAIEVMLVAALILTLGTMCVMCFELFVNYLTKKCERKYD